MCAVFLGRRVLKGVPKIFEGAANATTASAVGTERRRAVKSGADETLDEEGSEEDDEDENIRTLGSIVHLVS